MKNLSLITTGIKDFEFFHLFLVQFYVLGRAVHQKSVLLVSSTFRVVFVDYGTQKKKTSPVINFIYEGRGGDELFFIINIKSLGTDLILV